jgi:hypothetical protein
VVRTLRSFTRRERGFRMTVKHCQFRIWYWPERRVFSDQTSAIRRKPEHCSKSLVLAQLVRPAAKEFKNVEVAEGLELLTDFVADVQILGVEPS